MRRSSPSEPMIAVGVSVFATVLVAGFIFGSLSATAADEDLKPDLSLSAFMRKKLEASSQILEGLTTEDSELIERGAKMLGQLSKAEKWQILSDPDYREYSSDFRSTVKKLEEAAGKSNFDKAALQWIDVMKNCIECHQHVRSERASKTK